MRDRWHKNARLHAHLFAALAIGLLASASARAATLTWSGTSGATWGTDTTNWTGSGGSTPWDSTTGTTNVALFSTANALANVSTSVTVNGIVGAATATIQGGTISIGGATPTITSTSAATVLTINSVLSGSPFTKAGEGTLVLGGANALGAGTVTIGTSGSTVNAGYLRLTSSQALGSVTTINLPTFDTGVGAVQLEGGISMPATLNITSAGRNASTALTTGYTLKNNSGNNTWNGNITVNASGGSNGIVSDSGTLTITGTLSTTVSSGGNRAFLFGGNGDFLVSGRVVDGSAVKVNLQKSDAGTLILSGSNTYVGSTTINGGTLQIGNGGATGSLSVSSTITVASGATLAFKRSNTITQGTHFNSVISGSGGVAQVGSGTLALTGVNTYSGRTLVSAGVLAVGVNGSFANSNEIKVGDAGSSGAVLDLTAKTGGFTFGSGQTVSGIGTINIGTGVTVTSNGIWAPGNSIGSNAVTGNLTLSGTSQFELGTPGTSATAPGNADFTAVSGTLALGGTLVLLDNSGSNSQGSYGAGSYRLFTAPTVSGTFASVTAPAGATTTRVAMVYASGTSPGQGVFANVYNLAVGSVTSGTSVDLGLIHAGGSFTAQSLSIVNTAAAGNFSEGLDASVSGVTGNTTSGGSAITNLAAGGTSTTITVSLGDTTAGAKTGTVTVGYQSNGTASGLNTISIGSQVVSVAGSVFSGSATWNVNGGGSWGALASGTNWTSTGGIKAAPGTFLGYTNTDSATFGNTLTSGTGTILLDGAAPSLASLVFSNTTGRYVLDQGSGGSLTLAAASGKPTIDVIASGLHEIKTAILGTSGLQKTGLGKLILSGSSNYSGGTGITAGTLAVNGFLGGAVNVANGAILGGSGTLNGPVTVAAGGILAPGNSPGTLTMDSGLVLDAASILNFELNAANFTIGGGINDLIVVTGDFTLDGILNVSGIGDFSTVADNTKWRLFNYSGGTFTDGGLSLGSMPSVGATGKYFQIDTSTAGQVNLVIVPEPESLALASIGIAAAVWAARRRK